MSQVAAPAGTGAAELIRVSLDDDVETLQGQLKAMVAHANGLQDQVNNYRQLLCESLTTIAGRDANFKKNYDAQMVVLGDWIVSQKSYKELAIQLGERLKIDSRSIIELGVSGKLEVLKNSHNPNHKTNASDSEVASRYMTELLAKVEASKLS